MKKSYEQFYRQSHRLKGFNYAADGWYYVTICTKNREHFFGEIGKNKMKYSKIGKIAVKCWLNIPSHYFHVYLDKFIVMPNHIHGIVIIKGGLIADVATHNCASVQFEFQALGHYNKFGPQSKNLPAIIRAYKSFVKKQANQFDLEFSWQSRYYDHIIRSDEELYRIREYIRNNLVNWPTDLNNQ